MLLSVLGPTLAPGLAGTWSVIEVGAVSWWDCSSSSTVVTKL